MSDQLQRILAMVKDGRLTEAQASEMIQALDLAGTQAEAGDRHGDRIRQRRHSNRGRNRGRHANSQSTEEIGITIGSEVAAIIDKSLRSLNSMLGSAGDRFGPTTWLNDSNVNVMSKLHEPRGEGYTCQDNNFTVSKLDELRLTDALFCDNELHAASIKSASIHDGEFKGNELRGSSIKELNIDNGTVSNCQLNGAQVAGIDVIHAKIDDCALNGVQLRDINIDASSLIDGHFNGVKVSDLKITGGSSINELEMNGVKCSNLTITSSRIESLRMSALNVVDCRFGESTVSGVVFRNQDWHKMNGRNSLPAPPMHGLQLDRFTAENLEFINCRFDDTIFRDCRVADMKFVDVDFSGLTLESETAFAELAGQTVA